MISRRTLLKAGTTASLLAPFAGLANATLAGETNGVLRFGVIADPQYAPVVPNLKSQRYYSNSLWKLSEAIEAFNQEELSFVVTLGDIIDRHWESFQHVLPLYDKLRHKNFLLLGNHDYDLAAEYLTSVVRTVGLEKAYYDFSAGSTRFIVLDGNDISLFALPKDDPRYAIAEQRFEDLKAKGAENAQSWNGSLGDEQFSWFEERIKDAAKSGQRVIVMCHYPVYPANIHNLWDSERIVKLISSSPNVMAYFNGHNHAGNYGEIDGKHFLNFKGMVDTPDTTAYAIVEIHPDQIKVTGFGREESRTLAIATA